MRILLACIRYPPAPGGAESHVHAIAEGLASRGHEVTVHTSDLHTEYPFRRGEFDAQADAHGPVKVVRHRARRFARAWTIMPSMPAALKRDARSSDIVHAHSYGYFQTIAAARAAKATRTPFVFTPHFHPPWSMEGGSWRRTLRKVYDPFLGQPALDVADRIIAVSSGELDEMAKHMSVDRARCVIVPNGIDAARFDPRPDGAPFRALLGLDAGTPLIVYAGRLASNKGLPHLVDALTRLPRDAHLALAGEDQGWGPVLAKQARALGLSERVHVTGHLDEGTYLSALAAADVLALPSEWEAFGIVLAEAMACGTPVVATRVGGAPDVVVDGETGRLVPHGDERALAEALGAILADPALRARMGDAGRKRALANFTWEAVVDRTIGVYEAAARR